MRRKKYFRVESSEHAEEEKCSAWPSKMRKAAAVVPSMRGGIPTMIILSLVSSSKGN